MEQLIMKPPFKLPRRMPFGLIASMVESCIGLRKLDKLYHDNFQSTDTPKDFVKQGLELLDIDYQISQGNNTTIPEKGPLIIMANHPFGGVEGLVLVDLILKIRPDIKILTNQALSVFDSFNKICIDVDVLNTCSNKKKNWLAFNEARNWIDTGGALLLFPSGEVASWQWKQKTVVEAPWQNTVARLAQKTQANILPVFFEGTNSTVFHSLGLIHKRMRTIWLIRELINKKGEKIRLRIGEVITQNDIASLDNKTVITNYLRLKTLLLGCQQEGAINSKSKIKVDNFSEQEHLKLTLDHARYQEDVEKLDKNQLLLEKNGMQIWYASSDRIPCLLQEIGRLREIAFRAAGEGSGKALDLDEFDKHYDHLFLWNIKKKELAGAYRIGKTDEIFAKKGLKGLYSHSLFGYEEQFLEKLSPCLEMGRSFIRQEYQKDLSSLLLLWRGIGAYMVKYPHYRILFGPVTISDDYCEISRQLITSCLTANNYDKNLASLINPATPYKITKKVPWTTSHLSGINQVEMLSSLVKIIEGDKGIPILIKQYLKLRGEFVGFNLDKDFCNALDGLIIVDISQIDRRTLNKYIGAEQAERYFSYHQANKQVLSA